MSDTPNERTRAASGAALTRRIIRRAMESGVRQSDPLWPFVTAVCLAVGHLSETSRLVEDAGDRVIEEIRQAHGRVQSRERALQAALVERTARLMAMRWTAIAIGVVSVACGSFYLGRATMAPLYGTSPQDRRVVQAAPGRSDGLDQIRSWNDLDGALKACMPEIDGREPGKPRRYCRIPVWIDPPR